MLKVRSVNFTTFWDNVQNDPLLNIKYNRILEVVYVVTVISGNQAEAESGFSVHRHIKCPARNRLRTFAMDMLMRVPLLGGAPQDAHAFDFSVPKELYDDYMT